MCRSCDMYVLKPIWEGYEKDICNFRCVSCVIHLTRIHLTHNIILSPTFPLTFSLHIWYYIFCWRESFERLASAFCFDSSSFWYVSLLFLQGWWLMWYPFRAPPYFIKIEKRSYVSRKLSIYIFLLIPCFYGRIGNILGVSKYKERGGKILMFSSIFPRNLPRIALCWWGPSLGRGIGQPCWI